MAESSKLYSSTISITGVVSPALLKSIKDMVGETARVTKSVKQIAAPQFGQTP
jgi:hypothetical protein